MSAEKDTSRLISETAVSSHRPMVDEGRAILNSVKTSSNCSALGVESSCTSKAEDSGFVESTRNERNHYFDQVEGRQEAQKTSASSPALAGPSLGRASGSQAAPADLGSESEKELTRRLAETKSCLQQLEATHFELATRFFTSLRIHAMCSAPELLDSLREVVLNFTGVAEFEMYVHDQSEGRLFAVFCEPGSETPEQFWGRDCPMYANLTKLGRPWRVADAMVEIDNEIGVIPMYAQDRLVGALRLVSFLPQKSQLSDTDKELLALVAHEGAIGLENSWNRALAKDRRWTQTDMEELLNA